MIRSDDRARERLRASNRERNGTGCAPRALSTRIDTWPREWELLMKARVDRDSTRLSVSSSFPGSIAIREGVA
jgi:hypothetical protein